MTIELFFFCKYEYTFSRRCIITFLVLVYLPLRFLHKGNITFKVPAMFESGHFYFFLNLFLLINTMAFFLRLIPV